MNQSKVIQDLIEKWILKAEKDLLTAERELTFKNPVTESVCFHSQQAVEKFLKAYLVKHQIFFTKTHKIIDLLELCSTVDKSFKSELEDADDLTDYAVGTRYPDVWFIPTVQQAKESLAIAKKVKTFILNKFQE